MTFAVRPNLSLKVGVASLNFTIDPEAMDIGKPVTVAVRVDSDGKVYAREDGVDRQLGTWLVSGTNSNFEARMVYTSGTAWTTVPVADGSWIGLGSDRTWSTTAGLGDTETGNYTLEIRDSVSGITHDTNAFSYTTTSA